MFVEDFSLRTVEGNGCSQDAVIDELKQQGLWSKASGSASASIDAPPQTKQSTFSDNQKKATAAVLSDLLKSTHR